MKIGFFGDSFCAYEYGLDGNPMPYKTYIERLKIHYDAEIVHLGSTGSGIWDLILLQFSKFIETPPDICVFTWSNPDRLFNRTYRKVKPSYLNSTSPAFPEIHKAAKLYYKHLHDDEKAIAEAMAAVRYFDEVILSKVNAKIFHAWCFENTYNINNIDYSYKFKHGEELEVPLGHYTYYSNSKNTNSPNHIGGEEYNQKLFEKIRDAIDRQL